MRNSIVAQTTRSRPIALRDAAARNGVKVRRAIKGSPSSA
jgi:hypothetical protein